MGGEMDLAGPLAAVGLDADEIGEEWELDARRSTVGARRSMVDARHATFSTLDDRRSAPGARCRSALGGRRPTLDGWQLLITLASLAAEGGCDGCWAARALA